MGLRDISIEANKNSKLVVSVTPYSNSISVFCHSLDAPEIYVTLDIRSDKITIDLRKGKEYVEIRDKTEKQ